jgi:outer membrane protein assembly factor BamB
MVSGLALGPGDHLVAVGLHVTDELSSARDGWLRTELRLLSIDGASGEAHYRLTLDSDGAPTAGPAVAPDGSAHFVAWTDGYRQSELFSVTPDGVVQHTVLPEPPIGGGPSTLAVRGDGVVVLKEGTALLAYDTLGSLRWRREVHRNIDLGGTVDPAGDVLAYHSLLGGDTGDERWVSQIPAHREGGTFFLAGPIVVGDDVLYYYMAADDQLWAAGEPL